MRIALIQQKATPDKQDNLRRGLEALDEAVGNGAELVCYAELAFEPFYPQRPAGTDFRELAEPIPGPTSEAFTAKAAEHGVVVVLNLFERDGELTYDSSPVIDADGTLLGRTRMVHITDYPCFHEQDYYTEIVKHLHAPSETKLICILTCSTDRMKSSPKDYFNAWAA